MDNAHEYRLTPWNNDAISDLCGEAFYIRDEESGKYWSPSLLPTPWQIGLSIHTWFRIQRVSCLEDGIFSTMTVFVDLEDPVKYILFKIKNASGRMRKLSITGYVEWVLGDLDQKRHADYYGDQSGNRRIACRKCL